MQRAVIICFIKPNVVIIYSDMSYYQHNDYKINCFMHKCDWQLLYPSFFLSSDCSHIKLQTMTIVKSYKFDVTIPPCNTYLPSRKDTVSHHSLVTLSLIFNMIKSSKLTYFPSMFNKYILTFNLLDIVKLSRSNLLSLLICNSYSLFLRLYIYSNLFEQKQPPTVLN